jgi:hypothetical protein
VEVVRHARFALLGQLEGPATEGRAGSRHAFDKQIRPLPDGQLVIPANQPVKAEKNARILAQVRVRPKPQIIPEKLDKSVH